MAGSEGRAPRSVQWQAAGAARGIVRRLRQCAAQPAATPLVHTCAATQPHAPTNTRALLLLLLIMMMHAPPAARRRDPSAPD